MGDSEHTPPSLTDTSCCAAFKKSDDGEEDDPDLMPVTRAPSSQQSSPTGVSAAPPPNLLLSAPTLALLPPAAGSGGDATIALLPRQRVLTTSGPSSSAALAKSAVKSKISPPPAPIGAGITDPIQLLGVLCTVPIELCRLIWAYVDTNPRELHLFTGYNEFVHFMKHQFGSAVCARITHESYHMDRTLLQSSAAYYVALELQHLVEPFSAAESARARGVSYSASLSTASNGSGDDRLPRLPPLLRIVACAVPVVLKAIIHRKHITPPGPQQTALHMPDEWRELSSRDFWKEIERLLPLPLQRRRAAPAPPQAGLSALTAVTSPARSLSPTRNGVSRESYATPPTALPASPTGTGTGSSRAVSVRSSSAPDQHSAKAVALRKAFDALVLKYLLPASGAGSGAASGSGSSSGSGGGGSNGSNGTAGNPMDANKFGTAPPALSSPAITGSGGSTAVSAPAIMEGPTFGVGLYVEHYYDAGAYSRTGDSHNRDGGGGANGGERKKRLYVINHSFRSNVALQFDQPSY